MRYQLRVHLFTLFGAFFLAFFIFLALYAKYFYQNAVVDNLSTEWPGILQDRLIYSSQSVSTAFYMADKAFVDSVVRLSNLYEEASVDPFPIRQDAYPLVSADQLTEDKVIYGLAAYCNFEGNDRLKDNYKAVERLNHVWEQALLRRLGSYKNVNGDRILMLFDNGVDEDYECTYPAELFKKKDAETL